MFPTAAKHKMKPMHRTDKHIKLYSAEEVSENLNILELSNAVAIRLQGSLKKQLRISDYLFPFMTG